MEKNDYKDIATALFLVYTKPKAIRLKNLLHNPDSTYCKAKCKENNPGLPECSCHNFCKFDGIQFDTSLA